MKKIIFTVFSFVILFNNLLFSQSSCLNASPFCTGVTYTFPNSTGIPDLGPAGCMDGTIMNPQTASTPNAAWYYMQIDQSGPMTFTISQTSTAGSAIDVDYAMWGPYTSLSAGCGTGTFPIGNTIQSSNSPNSTETAALGALGGWDDVNCINNCCLGASTPPVPQVGDIYIILMANWSDVAGNFTFSQTGGSGSADCSFACGVNLTTNVGACTNDTYNVSGNLTVTSSPGVSSPNSGSVTISNSCGGSQTFNAPFTNIPYSFSGLTADGAQCSISVSFSGFPNCNTTQLYDAPLPCSGSTSCSFTDITGTTSSCTNNQYSISGTISYTNAPTTGTLSLTNSCGGTQTFNAPFGNSINYTFSGLSGDGSPCTISATFSDGTCSATLDYFAPNCNCPAEIGTFITGVTGNSNTLTKLCFGDQIQSISNNNWTPPNEILGATDPNSANYDPNAPPYDPGVSWLVYGCPPSIALTPGSANATNQTIPNDPCLLGVFDTIPNFTDINDLSLINSLPPGSFTNNTLYFVPITMYSIVAGTYSYVILPALGCYEVGTPISVQYLPEITYTQSSNCANGTATITLSGGSPQLNGTNFSVVPGSLTPSSANFVNSTTANGGTIVIGNLSTGPYSFDVVDDNGCPKTISGNYNGSQAATITYPDHFYCINEPNASPTIFGTQGGTFSSGIGLNINSSTGVINFQNSNPGGYTITYTTSGALCPGTSTFDILIDDMPIVDGGPDQTLCLGKPLLLSASGAMTYSWSNGLVDGLSYLPNVGQTEFTVIGSTTAGCLGYDTVLVDVIADCITDEDIVFWVPNTFTPDGDQFNQTFKPIFYSGFDPFGYSMFIYNRWGEIVWEGHDVAYGWDGTYQEGIKVQDGTYTWKIKFKLKNTDEKKTYVGHVNLIK